MARTGGPDGGLPLRERLASIGDPMALLEGLFAHSPVPYVVFRADGHPLATNRAYREMFGSEPPPEYNVLRDEVSQRLGLSDAIARAFAGETVHTPVVWYDPKELEHIRETEARRVAVACSFFPLRGAGGQVEHVAAAFKNVTAELEAREHAEAERDRLREIVQEKNRLASALIDSDERLVATLEAAEVGTWEWDIANDRVAWSRNIERIFGLPEGAFAGTYEAWLALVHPEDRPAIAQKVSDSLHTLAPYDVEFRFVRPDGSVGYQTARGYVVRDASGGPRLLRGIVLDVTKRRHAEQAREQLALSLRDSEARYRDFVAQSSEGIWRIELEVPVSTALSSEAQIEAFYRHAYLAECNDAMARMYGYGQASELIGARLGDLLVADDLRNQEYLSAFIESGYRLADAVSHETDREGNRRVIRNSLIGTVENGQVVRAWGTQRDATAEVEAREQAESANRAKDEFLAMLGHELRNPLSPILTALELMRMRDHQTFARERAIIERQVKHVVRLVDDLLDVSRITRGLVSLELAPADMGQVINSALEQASPLLEQRAQRLTVHMAPDLVVAGDVTRLAQVFTNLLTNAAKYTPKGGAIDIVGERQGDMARITVRDSGIGITADMLPRIFDLFVQERQALDRSQGGLGLGLSIVRSLVGMHGGRVEARSEGEGKGSEFSVVLPLSMHVAASGPEASAAKLSEGAVGYRVLVVDDNEDAAELVSEVLSGAGHRVMVAHDGPSALKLLESSMPDLAVLDIGLPVMNGYELAQRIRELPEGARVRLVALTGYGQSSDRAAAKKAGFDEHLVKPVDVASLERAVTRLMVRSSETP